MFIALPYCPIVDLIKQILFLNRYKKLCNSKMSDDFKAAFRAAQASRGLAAKPVKPFSPQAAAAAAAVSTLPI
jgi:hypothetical protein